MSKTTVPTDQGELEAVLADQEKVGAMIAAGTFPDLIKNYARATNEADKSLMEQVKEQTQAVMAQFLKDNPEAGKGKVLNLDPYDGPGKNGYHPNRNPNAVGAKSAGLFPDQIGRASWRERVGQDV